MLNTMIQTLKMIALLHGATVATVDRVEDNGVAVVCAADACIDVAGAGLYEGQTFGAYVAPVRMAAPMGDIKL